MRKPIRIILYAIGTITAPAVLIVVAGCAIHFSGSTNTVVGLLGPRNVWNSNQGTPAPDYADANAWAALPASPGLAASVPAGVVQPPKNPLVDVFFIHPTGYMGGDSWNSPLNPDSQTEENTQWMMANQASAYNGCCAVYAPRYREASIFRYIDATPDIFDKSGEFAYADVDRAFTYFLAHYSNGRPFIIASHSQGTEHGLNLVKRRIDGTSLAARMVAAYLIGSAVANKDVDTLKTVHACTQPADLHCIIHWATHRQGVVPVRKGTKGKLLCINPLTWTRDGGLAPASLHQGAVPISGRFQVKFWGTDAAHGMKFPPLGAPVKAWTTAECRDGFLFVKDQSGSQFDKFKLGNGNYHGLDYPLFAMDIRENASARAAAYLNQH